MVDFTTLIPAEVLNLKPPYFYSILKSWLSTDAHLVIMLTHFSHDNWQALLSKISSVILVDLPLLRNHNIEVSGGCCSMSDISPISIRKLSYKQIRLNLDLI